MNKTRSSKTSLFRFFLPFIFLIALAIAGCAGVQEANVKRDAGEVYSIAVNSYLNGRYEEAEKGFRTIMEDHPLSQYALDAQLMLGDVNYAMENYEDASSYYTSFVALHPSHAKSPYALFQKGMSHFKEVLSTDRDQTATRKALFAFEDLVSSYPSSPYVEKAREMSGFLKKRLAEKEFYIANFYFKDKNYKGALGRLRDLLKNYPDAGITDKALFYIGQAYDRLGEKDLAEDAFSTLVANYPQSPYARDAKGRLKKS